jgi:hypothetical protein
MVTLQWAVHLEKLELKVKIPWLMYTGLKFSDFFLASPTTAILSVPA